MLMEERGVGEQIKLFSKLGIKVQIMLAQLVIYVLLIKSARKKNFFLMYSSCCYELFSIKSTFFVSIFDLKSDLNLKISRP